MRHRVARGRINRFTSWRKATVKSMVRSLLLAQSIRTTKEKARLARSAAERLISLAKENTLANKRRAFQFLGDHRLVALLFSDIATRFGARNGGYTRMLSLGRRRGDNAEMVILELTELKKKEKKVPKKKKTEAVPAGEAEAAPQAHEHEHNDHEAPAKPEVAKEKPPSTKKPTKNFLGGLRGIFKKERDSL